MDFKPNIRPDYKVVEKFYFRYNKSRDGKLKYSEFMHAISPIDEKYATMLKDRKNNKPMPERVVMTFQPDTFNGFIRVLEHLFQAE